MTYRERRERRAERLREWAEKRHRTNAATFKAGEKYHGDTAFNTQPGHIPERARLIAREDRAFESENKANAMESRAAGIKEQLERAIYDDDPDAFERLEERIAALEAERDRIKAFNVSCRKGAPDWTLLSEKEGAELRRTWGLCHWIDPKKGFPSYHLTNLGNNIRRYKARLDGVREARERAAKVEAAFGGPLIERHPEANWCVVTFPEKPSRQTLQALKAARILRMAAEIAATGTEKRRWIAQVWKGEEKVRDERDLTYSDAQAIVRQAASPEFTVRLARTDVDFCAVYENGLLDRVGTFAETTLVHIPLDEGGGAS